jgi:hypothetical protein
VGITFRPEIAPFNPRNPQRQSITGQAKDSRAKESTMRFIPSIRSVVRTRRVSYLGGILRANRHIYHIRPS